ncbi:nucleotidyltransferase domain-containing protein [Verrucomicrobiota bacterium sgz303538]
MAGNYLTLRPTRSLGEAEREVNHELVAILDVLGQEIELPPSRVADAKLRYETIGDVLVGEGSALRPFGPRVYAQGSIGLGTPIKPLKTHEFDVDLACLFSERPSSVPDEVRRAVFNRLNGHGRYAGKVKLLARCIQLTYADEFHMDIMPCIPGTDSKVQVPDKRAGGWVLSDPEGYALWFSGCAALSPMRIKKAESTIENREFSASANAQVDPFPEWDGLRKRPLQRCVQLLKRHRDKMFYEDKSKAPSSIVITTLAAHSYARAVRRNDYECPIDLLEDVIDGMPDFIEVVEYAGQPVDYRIINPVLRSENFASKWKDDPALSENFHAWHTRARQSIQQLSKLMGRGLHELGHVLGEDYGQESAQAALRRFSNRVHEEQESGRLGIIVGGSGMLRQTRTVPKHTNFGR